MKILLINNFFCPFGGAENSTYRTAQVLRKNGHEVFFFATDRQPYFEENYEYAEYFPKYYDFSNLADFKLVDFIKNPSYFYNFESENKLDAYLKRIKPDIVHSNNITYYLSPSVLNACYKNNIPVIMTIRDGFMFCPDVSLIKGSESYCNESLCIKGNAIHCIMNRCNDKSLIKSCISAAEFYFRRVHRLYDRVSVFIATSKSTYDLLQKACIKDEKLALVNNFIDESFFNVQPEYSDKGYFLYTGRIAKEKGIQFLIEAMSMLPEDIKLHIVGSGPDEDYFKDQSEKLGKSNIEFTGLKSGKDLDQEYKFCRAVILPSMFLETFGLSIVEAFAYGKPVIGSRIGGIPEIIDNEVNGLIFSTENSYELAEAIRKLYADKKQSIEMGKNGRYKAEAKYSPDAYYSNLINIYKSVIKNPNISEVENENLVNK